MLEPGRRRRLVIDGGMGTELEARGAPMDHEAWCGLANLDAPDLVRAIHEDHIRAGADVIIANTFPCNRLAMEAAGFGDRVGDMNRAAVYAAIEARDRAAGGRDVGDRRIDVALGHVRGGLAASRREEVLLDVYGEQAEMLAHAGADLLVLEMLDARWATALAAAARTGLPVWAGIWADLGADGRPLRPKSDRPLEDDLPALLGERGSASTRSSSCTPSFRRWRPALDLVARHSTARAAPTPTTAAGSARTGSSRTSRRRRSPTRPSGGSTRGARLAGGCCGTRPEHVRAIRERVDRRGGAVSGR